jgi:hypothetical protein
MDHPHRDLTQHHPAPMDSPHCDLTKHHLSLTKQPVLVVCTRCSLALTRRAVYQHMKAHHEFHESEDSLLLALEKHKVVGTFDTRVGPVEPFVGVSIVQGMMCTSPHCLRTFSDPTLLTAHIRTKHPNDSSTDIMECYLQQIVDLDDCTSLMRVNYDPLKARGD